MGVLVAFLMSGTLLGVFLVVGRVAERKHLRSLDERESRFADLAVTTLKRPSGRVLPDSPPCLVCGEAVVASDGFKTWIFGFRTLIGGESKTYSRLFVRARREATLRMLAAARAQGCNAVFNVRYESTDIGGNTSAGGKQGNPMAVCMVSGTAYCMG